MFINQGILLSVVGLPGYYVAVAGTGSGTIGNPMSPTTFAGATIPTGSTVYFKRADTF